MIQAGGAALEQRAHDHHAVPPGEAGQELRTRAGDGLGEVGGRGVLALAAITFVMQFLQENDAGVVHAADILKTYGSKAMEILEQDPYLIARDIPSAGFVLADKIAMRAGVEKDDSRRLEAALIHMLLCFEQEGHVFGVNETLFEQSAKLTGVEPDRFEEPLSNLVDQEEVKIEPDPENDGLSRVYLIRLYRAETGIASRIRAVLSLPVTFGEVSQDRILAIVVENSGHGGSIAAPIAKKAIQLYLQNYNDEFALKTTEN